MNLESDECGEPQTTILYAQSGPQRRGPAHRQIQAHLRGCAVARACTAPACCLVAGECRAPCPGGAVPSRIPNPHRSVSARRQLTSSHFLCPSDRLLRLAASRPPRSGLFSRARPHPHHHHHHCRAPPAPRSAATRRRPRPDLRLACRYPRQPASCFALSVQIQRCAPRRSLEARWPLAPPCSF